MNRPAWPEEAQVNPERIEEFRRKLRSGDAVRVRHGIVEMAGFPATPAGASPAAANPQSPAGGAVAQEVTPSPVGVQVKAHEWGAS